MSFVVDPSPQVLHAVSLCSQAQQDFFTQVRSILAESPYEFRNVIQKNVAGDGRVFYQYYDGIVQLVFTYRVYPAEVDWVPGRGGYVSITKAEPPSWL